jgi:hypothetical protein
MCTGAIDDFSGMAAETQDIQTIGNLQTNWHRIKFAK